MRVWATAFLICGLLFLNGCGGQADETPQASVDDGIGYAYVIGVSPLTTQLEYYVGYLEGIQKASRDQNVEVDVIDSQWDAAKQESDIATFIERGVDAIICSPVDPEAIASVLAQAEQAGIAVIVEMTYVDGIYPLVGTDQFEGGVLAGQYAGDWINQTYDGVCDVAILDFPYLMNINDRVEGFKAGLDQTSPGANIVTVVDAQAKLETAMAATEKILKEYPNVRCIFGVNDDSAKGANAAFHSMDISTDAVCIIGFDADQGCRRLIAGDEYIKASVAADTDIIGAMCIDTAIRKLCGEELPEWVEVHGAQYLVTKENISIYQ